VREQDVVNDPARALAEVERLASGRPARDLQNLQQGVAAQQALRSQGGRDAALRVAQMIGQGDREVLTACIAAPGQV
jgi:hypothetical protein